MRFDDIDLKTRYPEVFGLTGGGRLPRHQSVRQTTSGMLARALRRRVIALIRRSVKATGTVVHRLEEQGRS